MKSFNETGKIARMLASIFTHSSTPEEEEAYRAWTDERPEHKKMAERILNEKTYEANNRLFKSFAPQKAWKKVYPQLGGALSWGLFSWKRSLKYAALVLILMLPLAYLIYNKVAEEPIGKIAPGTQGGKIILSDGGMFSFPNGTLPEGMPQMFVVDAKGINYRTPANKPQVKEFMNVLRTLHGMECTVTLSDSTTVHLNAESRLIYPVCFSKKERRVTLEGEAYFDVAPDKEHPFVVQTPHTTIRVTGTSFNVRAYADEPTESTTLVTGQVQIFRGNEKFELTPNQHFCYGKANGESTVAHVSTDLYTSWESGSFVFLNVPLREVMSYLAKWYGFRYTFDDEAAQGIRIGGYLNRYADMNPIIDMIKGLNRVNIYQKNNVLHISLNNN